MLCTVCSCIYYPSTTSTEDGRRCKKNTAAVYVRSLSPFSSHKNSNKQAKKEKRTTKKKCTTTKNKIKTHTQRYPAVAQRGYPSRICNTHTERTYSTLNVFPLIKQYSPPRLMDARALVSLLWLLLQGNYSLCIVTRSSSPPPAPPLPDNGHNITNQIVGTGWPAATHPLVHFHPQLTETTSRTI